MLAMLTRLLKFLPGLGGLLGKLGGDDSRVQEIKADAELADIRGFHRTGRISAAHAWKYAKVLIAVLLTIVFCIKILFPAVGISSAEIMNFLGSLVDACKMLFGVEM